MTIIFIQKVNQQKWLTFVNYFEFSIIINYLWKEPQETFSDSNSTAQTLSNDTKHDISWKYPSDTFEFDFLGFRQIACYLAEQFRQIACYLAERFRQIASSF